MVDEVAAGWASPEIADGLLMGRSTVKAHLAHIFTKLGLINRAEQAVEASGRATC